MASASKPSPVGGGSARLLTMKFMQRSNAASPQANPSTTDARPAKRQRMSDINLQKDADAEAVKVALAAEELKRTQALERHAVEAGDTKWTLSTSNGSSSTTTTPMKVVSAGYIAIDSPSARGLAVEDEAEGADEVARPRLVGRRSFGKFNRVLERQQDPSQNVSSSDSSDGASSSQEEGEEEDGTPRGAKSSERAAELRAQRKARRKEERAEASQLADRRRSKGVKLNKLSSISSGGGTSRPGMSAGKSEERCFICKQAGHRKKDCPQASHRSGRQ